MCRSRRELSNAYLLAKIGVDTAENEPLEVWGENSMQYSIVLGTCTDLPLVLVYGLELVHGGVDIARHTNTLYRLRTMSSSSHSLPREHRLFTWDYYIVNMFTSSATIFLPIFLNLF